LDLSHSGGKYNTLHIGNLIRLMGQNPTLKEIEAFKSIVDPNETDEFTVEGFA